MDLMIIIQILDIPGDQIFTKYWFYKVNYAISKTTHSDPTLILQNYF